jgi:tRNA(Ile)-lysidine synthase TilS/MesJ
MIYVKESQVIGAVKRHQVPVLKSPCPMDGNSKRESVKMLLKKVYQDVPEGRERILKALSNKNQYELWF